MASHSWWNDGPNWHLLLKSPYNIAQSFFTSGLCACETGPASPECLRVLPVCLCSGCSLFQELTLNPTDTPDLHKPYSVWCTAPNTHTCTRTCTQSLLSPPSWMSLSILKPGQIFICSTLGELGLFYFWLTILFPLLVSSKFPGREGMCQTLQCIPPNLLVQGTQWMPSKYILIIFTQILIKHSSVRLHSKYNALHVFSSSKQTQNTSLSILRSWRYKDYECLSSNRLTFFPPNTDGREGRKGNMEKKKQY